MRPDLPPAHEGRTRGSSLTCAATDAAWTLPACALASPRRPRAPDWSTLSAPAAVGVCGVAVKPERPSATLRCPTPSRHCARCACASCGPSACEPRSRQRRSFRPCSLMLLRKPTPPRRGLTGEGSSVEGCGGSGGRIHFSLKAAATAPAQDFWPGAAFHLSGDRGISPTAAAWSPVADGRVTFGSALHSALTSWTPPWSDPSVDGATCIILLSAGTGDCAGLGESRLRANPIPIYSAAATAPR